MGAADGPRSRGREALRNPWLIGGVVVGLLLICAWIAWAIHVGSEHGGRAALGVLIVWPAIVAVLAVLAIPLIWAFRVIRASAGPSEREADSEPESAEGEATETG